MTLINIDSFDSFNSVIVITINVIRIQSFVTKCCDLWRVYKLKRTLNQTKDNSIYFLSEKNIFREKVRYIWRQTSLSIRKAIIQQICGKPSNGFTIPLKSYLFNLILVLDSRLILTYRQIDQKSGKKYIKSYELISIKVMMLLSPYTKFY